MPALASAAGGGYPGVCLHDLVRGEGRFVGALSADLGKLLAGSLGDWQSRPRGTFRPG